MGKITEFKGLSLPCRDPGAGLHGGMVDVILGVPVAWLKKISSVIFIQSWSSETPPPPHPTLSDSTPNQTLSAVQRSSWSLEMTPIEGLALPTVAANHSEQVRSKISSRYLWTVGASTASGSCDRSPSPTMATLLPSMLTQGHPEWQPHANIPKGEWTKPTLCFAFL